MFDKIFKKKEPPKPEPKKKTPRKPRKKKLSPKEEATNKQAPWVTVLNVDLAEGDPGNGSFTLDWNDYFILDLKKAGYPGKTDEDIVDNWFRTVCQNVLQENFEQDQAQNPETNPYSVRYIQRTNRDDGKIDVS